MICNACHAVCNDKSNSCSTRLTSIITILGILQLATVVVRSGKTSEMYLSVTAWRIWLAQKE